MPITGTLTTNEMCVVKLAMPVAAGSSMKSWDVEGHNYTPVGRVSGLSINWTQSLALQFLAKIGCMCALTTVRAEDGRSKKRILGFQVMLDEFRYTQRLYIYIR